MSYASKERSERTVRELASQARNASRALAKISNESRNEILMSVAKSIENGSQKILEANERDCQLSQPAVQAGKMSSAMFARLKVSERSIREMAARVRDVARLADPLGRRLSVTELDEGLVLYKESCPLGVIGIVFESRPDVVPEVGALALKSGNAVVLKGGVEASHTNKALVEIWRDCLAGFPAVPCDSLCLLHTRSDVMELLTLDREVDLVIPRGSHDLVEFVSKNSRIPVLGHGEGICHVYIDRTAAVEKALRITFASTAQYPAACTPPDPLPGHLHTLSTF